MMPSCFFVSLKSSRITKSRTMHTAASKLHQMIFLSKKKRITVIMPIRSQHAREMESENCLKHHPEYVPGRQVNKKACQTLRYPQHQIQCQMDL